jgi:hypothetical protein
MKIAGVETTKLVRVHHLRWVPEIFTLAFNFVHKLPARRPTVFDNPDLFHTYRNKSSPKIRLMAYLP